MGDLGKTGLHVLAKNPMARLTYALTLGMRRVTRPLPPGKHQHLIQPPMEVLSHAKPVAPSACHDAERSLVRRGVP